MIACTKGQLSINLYQEFAGNRVGDVPAIMYNKMFTHRYGFKSLLFPLLIPVAVFSSLNAEAYLNIVKGHMAQYLLYAFFVKNILLNIARQSTKCLFKGFKSNISSHCSKDVTNILEQLFWSRNGEFYFVIPHYFVNFDCKIIKNRENPTIF